MRAHAYPTLDEIGVLAFDIAAFAKTPTSVRGLRIPTTIAGCCARAASGHVTAAPPSSVMKSRRLMGLTRGQGSQPSIAGLGCVSGVRRNKKPCAD
jgi:hypothetical protein